MNDFDRVAAVIRFLDENHTRQPALAELARAAGLSESHFHRLFRRWAGITPKDFLQCLTAEHAKRRLRESASVLEATLDAGLSGPGRLHDLLVTIEAASPGEYRSGGRGLVIEWGIADSPFGVCSVGWNSRGICHIAFHGSVQAFSIPPELPESWPQANFHRNDPEARSRARIIFTPEAKTATPLNTFVRATPFQLQVWRALLRIPDGELVSYQFIAESIGNPKAMRAVGTACGANAIAYLIPCHRVIRQTGIAQGYRWGTLRKRVMLGYEAARKPIIERS